MIPFHNHFRALVAITAILSAPALAATDCVVGTEMANAAARAANNNRQLLEQIDNRQKNLAANTGTCLDKYMNTCLTCQLGIDGLDLGGLIGQLAKSATNAACAAVDTTMREATAPLNQSVVLPGGIGRVNTSIFGNGMSGGQASAQINIPGAGQVTVGQVGTGVNSSKPTTPPSFVSQVSSYVSNLFK